MRSEDSTRPLFWVDVAKAACVCLVVLMHGEAQIAVAGWAEHDRIIEIWHAVNAFLKPIRIPTFFTISGILAAKAIMRPGGSAFRKGFVKPIYLYLVWATVFAVLIPNYPAVDAGGLGLRDRVQEILLLGSPAWYLYALGLFYLVAKATRNVPVTPLLVACFAISLIGSVLLRDEQVYAAKFSHSLFFFVAGVRLKDQLIAFGEAASPGRSAALLAIYVAGSVVASPIETHLLALDIAAVAFGLATFSMVCTNLGAIADHVQWIGRRTLFVYVLHFPLLCLLTVVVRRWGGAGLIDSFWLGLAYPLVAAALVVPASLALGVLLQRIGLGLLFDLPGGAGRTAPAGPTTLENSSSAAA